MSSMRIGVDLGGTKIRVVAITTSPALTVHADERIETPSAAGYSAVVDAIVGLVQKVEYSSGANVPVIGLGTPGVLDRLSRRLKNSNTQCLNGERIQDDLALRLKKEILIENDANCFAVAEDRLGAAKGSSLTFGVILGTGVGGGVVINGKPRYGLQGIGGEWGHNVIEPNGEPCYCGKRGCVERVLSGPALEAFYLARSGKPLRLPEISQRADEGEPYAQETINRLLNYFAQAISVVVNILDPDYIVLGGGVSNISALYTQGSELTKPWIFNTTPQIRVVKNQLGDSAGVFGAAMLAEE